MAAHASWQAQMPDLVASYLEWKHGTVEAAASTAATSFEITAIHTFCKYIIGFDRTNCCSQTCSARTRLQSVQQNPNELANVALIRNGLLGCSPESPSAAISLNTLELYHRLRRQHGQLSVQAMAKTLCDLHNVSDWHLILCIWLTSS